MFSVTAAFARRRRRRQDGVLVLLSVVRPLPAGVGCRAFEQRHCYGPMDFRARAQSSNSADAVSLC